MSVIPLLAHDGRSMDGKSILGILLLAASQGAWLEVETEGEDEAGFEDDEEA